MAKLHSRVWYLFVVGLLFTPCLHISGPGVACAQGDGDDEVMGEGESVTMRGGGEEEEEDEEDMEVEDEEDEDEPVKAPDVGSDDEGDDEGAVEEGEEEEEEEEEEEFAPHPDCESTILFINRPTGDFVAGELVEAVIGLTNTNTEKEFIVTLIEGSFRYPQDFSYYIQNFTAMYYETYIMPQTQASFVYMFRPSDSFYARPFGLTIDVYYKDADDNEYRDAVFNNTVNIVEVEEGFDAETFFMYLFMVSGISLLVFIIHYVYTTVRRGGRAGPRKPIETGTQDKEGVDYQWVPDGAIPNSKKSPRPSPRPRKTKK